MHKIILGSGVAVAIAAGIWLMRPADAPETAGAGAALAAVTVPETFSEMGQLGERAFAAKCAVCHGENAGGVDGSGPPLVHKIYEPSHHGDAAFERAAMGGVRSHHWGFGNMPPVEGLTRGDIKAIIAYVRELQRANGIH